MPVCLSVKVSISIFSHINFPKITDKCRRSLNNKPRVLEHLLPTSLDFRMKFKWQALYDSKRHCSTLVWGGGGQNENYDTSARHAQSYPRVSTVHSWKYICSSNDNLYRKKLTSFFDPHLTLPDKMKNQIPIANLQDLP